MVHARPKPTDRVNQLDHNAEALSPCHMRLRLGNEHVVPGRQGGRENGCTYDV